MKNLVSIVIPTFNEEKNIGRLLLSIRSQTYKEIESIVVDDSSTDKTVEIAQKYVGKIYRRRHADRSVQRNFGASKAKGQYLLFLDADMELTPKVVEDCIRTIKNSNFAALIIPEKTTGQGFVAVLRKFERQMYEGDPNVEVARFFKRRVFDEFGGYDPLLTGPEDYDLPYRISKKYKIGRGKEYLLHHETALTLPKLFKKRFHYANRGAYYAQKHPELIWRQGILIFRLAYLRHWRKFLRRPFVGIAFLFVRTLETIAAGLGFLKAVLTK